MNIFGSDSDNMKKFGDDYQIHDSEESFKDSFSQIALDDIAYQQQFDSDDERYQIWEQLHSDLEDAGMIDPPDPNDPNDPSAF